MPCTPRKGRSHVRHRDVLLGDVCVPGVAAGGSPRKLVGLEQRRPQRAGVSTFRGHETMPTTDVEIILQPPDPTEDSQKALCYAAKLALAHHAGR